MQCCLGAESQFPETQALKPLFPMQAQYLPLHFRGHVQSELNYLVGPSGLRAEGVIADCPSVAMAWLHSISWFVPLELKPGIQ